MIFLDLCQSFEGCTDKPHPEAHRPEWMYDIKEWLQPHSHDLHQHVQPHCFKFVRNHEGKAVMFYRKWSGEAWMGPVRILKASYFFKQPIEVHIYYVLRIHIIVK